MKSFSKSLASLVGLAILTWGVSVPAAAQFAPGHENTILVNGRRATTVEITQISPGKARFEVGPVNAVYLDTLPSGLKAHTNGADESGKGRAYVVSANLEPSLSDKLFCWRGVGLDWETFACAPMQDGLGIVTIDLGTARGKTFALVPIIADSQKNQLAWAAHPENSKTLLDCPNMAHKDMASVFHVDAAGTISIATPQQVVDYSAEIYSGICQR